MDGGNPVKPRIAILTNYPADFTTFTGGVETATAALLEGLRKYQDDFEFHVVSVPQGLTKDIQIEKDGFRFHFLSTPSLPIARPRQLFRVVNGLRKLREIAPDLVHCQDNIALALAAILSGYPRLFTVHGVRRHEASKRTGWARWSTSAEALIEPYVHRRFQSFVCISGYTRRVLGKGKKLFNIANPVRSMFFQVNRNGVSNSLVLLFVGDLSPLKRPMDLLLAHQELRSRFPTLETVFCGAPGDDGYFQQIQRQTTEGARFVGRVQGDKLVDWLSRSAALVLPSSQENLPIVIAEAMAAGVPVVASRVGGVPEMVEHEQTGFLCNVGNIGGLIKRLECLLSNPTLQAEMGQMARQKALDTYHPDLVAYQTTNVYRTMLSKGNSER